MIASSLNIEMTKASEIFGRLVSNGVVGPANALGISQTRPLSKINAHSKFTDSISKSISEDEIAAEDDVKSTDQVEQNTVDNLDSRSDDII